MVWKFEDACLLCLVKIHYDGELKSPVPTLWTARNIARMCGKADSMCASRLQRISHSHACSLDCFLLW